MTNIRFAKILVAINCAVPLAMLTWDYFNNRLGANPTSFAILTTGMLTLIFICLTLLVTPVRKITGYNWLISFRRTFGLYAFAYGCVHFLIYFLKDQSASVSSTLLQITRSAYLIYGVIALVLMIPLALTSTNAMIKRLGPKRWAPLHRLVYLVAIAAVIHFYQQAKADERLPKTFILVVAILLAYRVEQKIRAISSAQKKVKAGAG